MTTAYRQSIRLILLLAFSALVAACAYQPMPPSAEPPGFLLGLLHGFAIFFSLIASVFTDIRIYAFPNTGFFYDLGFFFGASAILGGGGAGARSGGKGG